MVNYIKSIYFRKSVVKPPSVFLNHFRNLCFSITNHKLRAGVPERFLLRKGGITYGTWNYCETAGGRPQVQGHDLPLALFGQGKSAIPV